MTSSELADLKAREEIARKRMICSKFFFDHYWQQFRQAQEEVKHLEELRLKVEAEMTPVTVVKRSRETIDLSSITQSQAREILAILGV